MRQKELSPRQQRFVDEYLVDLNAGAAYRRAGFNALRPNVAEVNASRLLRNAKVQTYLAERQHALTERTAVTQDDVLHYLKAIAFSNISDFVESGPKGMILKDLSKLDPATCNALRRLHVTQDKQVFQIHMQDKVRALTLLAKYLGMLPSTRKG